MYEDFTKLQNYLKNARDVYLKESTVDGKSLSKYYVDNKAFKADKQSWNYAEDHIKKEEEWNLEVFLKDSYNHIELIAAPFGIGKSSIVKKLSFDCANKFIVNPTDPFGYVPIFAELKFSLQRTCNGDASLENDLSGIASLLKQKDSNILVILDGLDETSLDKKINYQNIYEIIQQNFIKYYPNSKYIITTRLEAGFPNLLTLQIIILDYFHLMIIKSNFF